MRTTRAVRLANAVFLGLALWQLVPEGSEAKKAGDQVKATTTCSVSPVRCSLAGVVGKVGGRDYDSSGRRCVVGDGDCPSGMPN
jgi:hypothetical protein